MVWPQLLEQWVMYVVLLSPFNLSLIQHPQTGVGGYGFLILSHILPSGVYLSSRLTLGGGVGHLSGEHGLVIDNLIKVVFLLDHVIVSS
jgi:hypothetical protein